MHISLCVYTADALQPLIRPRLAARVGHRSCPPSAAEVSDDQLREAVVGIIDPGRGMAVITLLAFITPQIDRSARERKEYLDWCRYWHDRKANIVEIDLLRGDEWSSLLPRKRVPVAAVNAPYHACACRAGRGVGEGITSYWPLPLEQRLPVIAVPLRPGDPDVPLDLQPIVDREYLNGGFDDQIDYAADADPPLTGDAAAWADGLLRAAGRRPTPPA